MVRFLVALVVILVGVGIAYLLRRRDAGAMAQGKRWSVPAQLERSDFTDPEADRLVVVFSSDSCDACAATWEQVNTLVGKGSMPRTALQQISYQDHADLHDRYGIDAVPTLLVADADGVVQRSFVGPPEAKDLADALSVS